MEKKKEVLRIIASSKQALEQLDKLINQNIDLANLDPEKAAQAVKGKIEAIEGSFRILNLIQEEEAKLKDKPKDKEEKDNFFGVEDKIKK